MRLRKLKIFLYRRKLLLSKHFWDNVYIRNKETKKNILYWMSELKKYRNISIDKFESLICKNESIVFPIQVTSISRVCFNVEDSVGNEYYLICYPYNYAELDNYVIGIRSNSYDKDGGYHIASENNIVLSKRSILPLNEDSTNKDYSITFNYNSKKNTTTAILETPNSIIEISYLSQQDENEDKISEILFEVANENSNIDDVFSVFVFLFNILKGGNNKVQYLKIKSIDKKEKECLSEILLSNNVVEKYLFTETISETEICFHKLFPFKLVEKFISEHENKNE